MYFATYFLLAVSFEDFIEVEQMPWYKIWKI